MKFDLDYSNAGINFSELNEAFQKLKPEVVRAQEAVAKGGFHSDYASLNLAFAYEYQKTVQSVVDAKKILNPSALVVIGIGGSNLGTLAIQEALLGKFYNATTSKTKIYYADTVDSDYLQGIMHLLKQELNTGKPIILNVVTKSGTTTETIAIFELFLKLLIGYYPNDYKDYVVITTDRDSVLWKIGLKENFTLLEVPKKVGGRYSVFSAVGLFPLGMLGCDSKAMLEGARSSIISCAALNFEENYAALTACVIYLHYKKHIAIQDMFLFSVQLEGLGKWYRQLMGESIGKEFNIKGNKVEVGITPTVSLGTVDLHSVGQLYLGGPRDKNTTFVSIEHHDNSLVIPQFEQFDKAVPKIQGKSLSSIMDAILQGVKTAYATHQRPFISIKLPESNAYYIGQFLQYKMIEMMYLGYLLEVNPFDQPNVELYKEETRKILNNC